MNENEWVNSDTALEGLPLLHICLRFNNNLKRAAPVVRLEDLFNSVTEIMYKINSNSQFTINLYVFYYVSCVKLRMSTSKINEWMIQLRGPSTGEMREFIRRATLTVHYGDSLAVECTSVVHSFLRCIVGLNECTREPPLWLRTPLKMVVPSNSALFEGMGAISDTTMVFDLMLIDCIRQQFLHYNFFEMLL